MPQDLPPTVPFDDRPTATPTLPALVQPVAPLGSNAVTGPTLVGGRYLLGERLGAGGMGCVYRAEQTHPVQRAVAVKLIRPGMDTDEFLLRFEAERRAVARMDHPNIATVYDAGATDDGRPYFALELVDGVPLARYCDEKKLPLRRRVELFVPVCRAVQHAHQKGVIHRDLKPTNVLVAEVDGRPTPKVIDFGIAKAVAGDQLAAADTRTGVVIGTPEYMSPEQAGATAADVDTRSDVYSLGVMLYELLAGTTPFGKAGTEVSVYELLRQLRETDPPRPRSKLGTPGAAGVAAARGGDPERLRRELSGELEWVVLKALERDRERRYQSAAGLADDLERYLRDEPLEAGPPSRGYRLRKFVARNRVAVTAGAVTAAALVAGSVAAVVGLVQSRRAEAVAVAAVGREAEARQAAEADREKAQRAEAEARRDREAAVVAQKRTRAALLAFTDEVAEGFLGRAAQLTPDEQQFLNAVEGQLARLAAEAGPSSDDRAVAGECRGRLGSIQVRLGRLDAGEASLRAAVVELERFTGDDHMSLLARYSLSRFLSELGLLCLRTNRADQAIGWFDRAVGAAEGLTHAAPTADNRARLAQALGMRGNYWSRVGRLDRAAEEMTTAQVLIDELVKDDPLAARWRIDQAANRDLLGGVYETLRRDAAAVREWRAAADILEGVVGDRLYGVKARVVLAAVCSQLARVVGRADPEEAGRCYRRAIELRRQLATDYPAVPQYRTDYALSAANYASRLTDDGRLTEAARYAADALAIRERLAADHPTVSTYRIYLAHSLCTSGRLARLTSRPEAAGLLDRAVREIEPAHRAEPTRPLAREISAMCHRERAEWFEANGKPAAAAADWREFRATARPKDATFAAARLALALATAGQSAEAGQVLGSLDKPDWQDAGFLLGRAWAVLAAREPDAATRERHAAAAVRALEKAVQGRMKNPLDIRTEPDFALFRDRADFRALLSQLPPELLPNPRADGR